MKAPGLHDPFPARPDDPDERPAITQNGGSRLSLIGNVLWFVLAGWWLALGHLLTGIVLCLTIIGIPLGIADIKMAGAALVPFGRQIVQASELNAGMVAAPSTVTFPD